MPFHVHSVHYFLLTKPSEPIYSLSRVMIERCKAYRNSICLDQTVSAICTEHAQFAL